MMFSLLRPKASKIPKDLKIFLLACVIPENKSAAKSKITKLVVQNSFYKIFI